MATTITSRQANLAFPCVIHDVERGKEFTIARQGEPAARLGPVHRERMKL
jgi:antitoxin (DNA-binding transcriptional repressor) of toxin-antitoxin stability system